MNYNYTLIIPHFNIPQLLNRLLRTVPKRDDLQVIVVDDCSTKGTEELELLKKKYNWVEWYDTGTNGGGGKARNIGLRHAEGKYIIFADADDYFNINFNEILDLFSDTEYDIIYFAISSVDSETLQNSRNSEFINGPINSLSKEDVRFFFTTPWAKFISLKLITKNKIHFHETCISNDVYFSTQVDFYANKIAIRQDAIYCWTVRKESVSRHLTNERAIIRLHEDNIRRKYLKELGLKDAHKNYLYMILDLIFISKNRQLKEEAIDDCKKMIGLHEYKIYLLLAKYRGTNCIKRNLRKVVKYIRHYIS